MLLEMIPDFTGLSVTSMHRFQEGEHDNKGAQWPADTIIVSQKEYCWKLAIQLINIPHKQETMLSELKQNITWVVGQE